MIIIYEFAVTKAFSAFFVLLLSNYHTGVIKDPTTMNEPFLKALDSIPAQKGCVGEVWERFSLLDNLRPNSSSRVPDWRWKLVPFIFEFPWLKKQMRHDLGFAMAIKLYYYLQYLESLGSRRPRKKPLPEGVMEAYALYQLPLRKQAELKARLLAKEALPVIAQKINSTVAAITWYEHLFFNIFDRIQSRSYISHKVTRLLYLKPTDPSFLSALWMELGYCAGPEVVDLLVDFQDRILEPLTHEDLLPPQDTKESILRSIKLLIYLRTTLYDSSTYHPLIDTRGFMELTDRKEQTKLMIQQIQEVQALSAPLADINLDHEAMNLDHDNTTLDHEDITAEQDLFEYESILPRTAHETAQKLVI